MYSPVLLASGLKSGPGQRKIIKTASNMTCMNSFRVCASVTLRLTGVSLICVLSSDKKFRVANTHTHTNENRKHVRNRRSRNLCQSLNFKPRPGRQKPNIYQLSEFNEASWTWTVVDTHHHSNKWPKEKGWTQECESVHGEVSAPREEQPASRLANISPREAALNALRAARRSSADMKTTRTINGHLHYRFLSIISHVTGVSNPFSTKSRLRINKSRLLFFQEVLNSFIGTFLEKQKPDWM